jgi:hypothetical protein
VLSPGFVQTEGTKTFIGSDFEKTLIARTPLGQVLLEQLQHGPKALQFALFDILDEDGMIIAIDTAWNAPSGIDPSSGALRSS